ncbi:hypothetical protein AWENTII_002258 [Aspergillus wentii]
MPSKIYLVTGANRGLGLGLVKALIARPSATVIATVRTDDAAATLKSEITIRDNNSILHILTLDFTTAIPPSQIQSSLAPLNISHIDVLICNAGHIAPMHTALETSASDLRASFETNTIAPLLVFQACWPLLQSSPTGQPKAIMLSSSVGSITSQEPFPGGAYGASRAAGNWLTRALHLQNEESGLVAVALHPGWVKTRAGEFAASEWGVGEMGEKFMVSVEESVRGMLAVIDGASRETVSGRFVSYTGDVLEW